MKNFKFLMPVMAFVMAVGLAFANKADVQSNGYVERDGELYQLQNDPCNSGTNDDCVVRFTDDLNTPHQVFTDANLQIPKKGGNGSSYILAE